MKTEIFKENKLKKIYLAIAVAFGIMFGSLPAQASLCANDKPPYTFFDFYPLASTISNVSEYGWPRFEQYGWPHQPGDREDFQRYTQHYETVTARATTDWDGHWWFKTTAGAMYNYCYNPPVGGQPYNNLCNSTSYNMGWVAENVFRTVLRSGGRGQHDAGNPGYRSRRFTTQSVSASFWVASLRPTTEAYRGIHLFTYYNTEDDYYVASLRMNGDVLLQRQTHKYHGGYALGCPYEQYRVMRFKRPNGTRLPVGQMTPIGVWYNLKFTAIGNFLQFTINGVDQFDGVFEVLGPTFESGTGGIRTDYVNTYLDDISMTDNQ